MPNGEIQSEFRDTLASMGKWMQANGNSIYGTRGGVIAPQNWGTITTKGNQYFVHILKPAAVQQQYIFLPGFHPRISAAQLFNSDKRIRFQQQAEGVFIYLDGVTLNDVDTIIQLNAQ
jgi:alpha-L-fucosidase